MNDERERRLEALLEATGENTKSKAIDRAAKYYVRMAGGTTAAPVGKVEDLMNAAVAEGNLTADQIADILDTDELPVHHKREWSVGTDT
jgi:hypothetical protein